MRGQPGIRTWLKESSIPTSISTRRTQPALSARYIQLEEKGSGIAFKILDWRTIGLPFLLPDLAALRARVASDASVWKKWPGSVDRDIPINIWCLGAKLIVFSIYKCQDVLLYLSDFCGGVQVLYIIYCQAS